MNLFSAIANGLIIGASWGLVKNSYWGKFVFVGLLIIGLVAIFVVPVSAYADIDAFGVFIQFCAFLAGSWAGEDYHKKWFA